MGRSGKGRKGTGFNVPFRDLARKLKGLQPDPSEAGEEGAAGDSQVSPAEESDEGTLFDGAMSDVTPLKNRGSRRAAAVPRQDDDQPLHDPIDPEAEAYATLSDLVSGIIPFDISDTDEYIEGRVAGFDHNVLRKLRRGEFSIQSHLDLHGFSRREARSAVEQFIMGSVAAGYRCVLIIHGRGKHSPDKFPVLKEVMGAWLSRGKIGRAVLAFASACPVDGGAGALYVLLRRNRRR